MPEAKAVPTVEPRVAFLNAPDKNQHLIATKRYARNVIVTSKYTVASFVPKTIFEFFRVTANIYFLAISLLQLATPWSPTNKFTTAGPLVFVLLVTMVKQGSEDLKRHRADDKQNNRFCRIVNARGEMELIAWQELQVGQLLCIENNEEMPADVVVLATSEEEGRCFIETANLDGETNLKRRVAVTETCKSVGWRALNAPVLDQREVCQAASTRLHGSVEYEQPNNQLYTFTGRLLLEDGGANANAIPLGPENIMLRGCGVRSCSFVIGLVIFTGSETKLLQNSRAAPSKQSKLYRTANRCMLLIFMTMFALCLVSAIVAAVWNGSNDGRVWYLPSVTADSFGDFVVNFFTFLILYNNLVPISLYVSLDIIKVLQANQITADARMVCDGFRAIARTSDLNEELGQIEYIFSDKTGTLTCNLMEFRKCSIGGVSYGFGTTEIGRAVAAMQKGAVVSEGTTENEAATNVMVNVGATDDAGASGDRISPASPVMHHHHTVPMSPSSGAAPESDKLSPTADEVAQAGDMRAAQVHHDPSIHFDDPALLKHLAAGGEQSERIHEFLTLLSICHTVIPETDPKTGKVAFRASSPDEEALVKAARCLGYNFVAPAPLTKVEVTRKYPTTSSCMAQYTILNVNEFNSSRKRMSVVAVNAQNQYVLYCKGADNMMLPRAVSSEDDGKMLAHLKAYASEGLRTLVLARRVLTDDEYAAYNEAYIAASTSLTDREEMLDACAEMIEKDMTILGVTAIEDKLQEGVPSTIFDLAQAGIKIWVLTGDREETAINIGHACRLLDDKMQLLYVNAEDAETLEKQLDALFHAPQVQALMKSNRCAPDLAMICDGKALVHVFPSKEALRKCSTDAKGDQRAAARARELAKKLLSVASVCKALVACRVSPSQKAEIVNLVRRGNELLGDDGQGGDGNAKKWSSKSRKQQPITLAIGDGANDVSMIQTAHVGVGISGKEGVQAVNASDYAIAQFRFLKRLVLIHGRSNYQRICKVIKYSFYKNIALVVSLFLYNFFNGQSGAPLFESFVMAGWNFFLALPIIVIGVFDRDLPERVVLQYPKLYLPSQQDSDLNLPVFALTIANSAVHALIVFWVCWLCYNPSHSMFVMGTLFYSALLATMKLKVFLLTLVWNKYHLIVIAFSVWLYFFFLVVYPRMTFLSFDMFGVPAMMVKEKLYWSLVAVCPLAAMLIDFTVRTAQQQFFPQAEDILRERFPAASNADSEEGSDADGKPTLHSARSLKLMGLVPLRLGGSGVLPDKVFITDKSGMEDDHDHPRSARIKQHDLEDLESGATGPSHPPRRASGAQPFDRYQSFQDVGHAVEADGRPVRRTSSTSNLAASLHGFAFNALESGTQATAGDMKHSEVVTARVLSFNQDQQRLGSLHGIAPQVGGGTTL